MRTQTESERVNGVKTDSEIRGHGDRKKKVSERKGHRSKTMEGLGAIKTPNETRCPKAVYGHRYPCPKYY